MNDLLPRVCLVIPSYKAANTLPALLTRVPECVSEILIVDDRCPDSCGEIVSATVNDSRISIIYHSENRGVGGAVVSGYSEALRRQADIIVRIDSDGQMNPEDIPDFIEPILKGKADFVKGNRFSDLSVLRKMPTTRLLGNSVLSFANKLMSGYWDIMDPTNGFTAIHVDTLEKLPLEQLAPRYFFEADLLFQLSLLRAVVQDVPMEAQYGEEVSGLSVTHSLLTFPLKYGVRTIKRFFYNHFLRDFNLCSLQLVLGILLLTLGGSFGAFKWYEGNLLNEPSTSGTVMLAGLPVILGFQLLLAAMSFDVMNVPRVVISSELRTV